MSLCVFCENKESCDKRRTHNNLVPCVDYRPDDTAKKICRTSPLRFEKGESDLEDVRDLWENHAKSTDAKADGGKLHPSYVTEKERSQISFMTSDTFESICEEQMDICRGVLFNKAKECAQNDDRLHNFRSAAGMTGDSMQSALSGMMLKHTISVYDMCRSRDTYPLDLWTEKITDHINYLLLLKAVVVEEAGNP